MSAWIWIGAIALIALILLAPVIGLIVLAVCAVVALVAWLLDDPRRRETKSRPCPRCGEPVDNGVLDCPHCEFDFRDIGSRARDAG